MQVKYPRASCVDCKNLRSTYWWLVIQNDPFAIGASIQIEVIMDIWKDCKRHANYTSIQKCYSNCPVSMFLFSSVCPFVCLSVYQSRRPSGRLSIHPSVCSSVRLSMCCSQCRLQLSFCLPPRTGRTSDLFVCLSVCVFICLSAFADR